MSLKVILLLSLFSCSTIEAPPRPQTSKEFSRGEVILATQLLSKIYDQEMAPLKCVPDLDEAALLLRTLTPRMEVVQDDLEAMLDDESEIKNLVSSCDQNCTCSFIDDLFREHLVNLDKKIRINLDQKKKQKDLNSCLNYVKETFCDSELFKELDLEKVDFSYREESD
jgi:hypothetical protein